MIALKNIRTHLIAEAVAADLVDAVNDWIDANAGERTFINIQYQWDGATYTAMIVYTE